MRKEGQMYQWHVELLITSFKKDSFVRKNQGNKKEAWRKKHDSV